MALAINFDQLKLFSTMDLLKKIKITFSAFLFLSIICFSQVNAQDAEITDEDLRRYALLNEVVDLMKKEISVMVNDLIKNQEGMTGQRFKELMSAKGDASKYEELGAKEYEVKFMELIAEKQNERVEAIKTVNQELATKMLGENGKLYNQIKNELSSNSDLKAKYDQIAAGLKMESAG